MAKLSGRLQLSDEQIFQLLAEDTDAKARVPRLAETYDAYKDVQKEHIAWSRHYFVAVGIFFASQLDIIVKFPPLEAMGEQFIPLAALVYVTYSILMYSNLEMKMRLYRVVYDAELETLDSGSRLVTMMRYPLAFYGSTFNAPYILMKTHTMSNKDLFFEIPCLLLYLIAKPALWLCVAALVATTGGMFARVAQVPVHPSWIKYVVLTGSLAALLFSARMVRSIKKRHVYEEKVN